MTCHCLRLTCTARGWRERRGGAALLRSSNCKGRRKGEALRRGHCVGSLLRVTPHRGTQRGRHHCAVGSGQWASSHAASDYAVHSVPTLRQPSNVGRVRAGRKKRGTEIAAHGAARKKKSRLGEPSWTAHCTPHSDLVEVTFPLPHTDLLPWL